jgi:hypothetical protein
MEYSTTGTIVPQYDSSLYLESSAKFIQMQGILFTWGISVLATAWFFGQCGFNGIISAVLANGIQVGLAMMVATARELSLWSEKVEWLSPPVHLIYRSAAGTGAEIAPEVVLVSLALSTLMIIGGVLIARRRGIPVWSIKRSGMDKLYLKIPEGN